ncbi:unnamed protein product [Camellia sinensis]
MRSQFSSTLINFNSRQRASSTAHNKKTRCKLDCGIIVCYIMRQYVSNNNIMPTFSKAECNQLRADMLTIFLTDQQVAQQQIPDENIDGLPLQ